MRKYYLLVLSLCLAGNVYAEQYLCIVNKSTGFLYSESAKSWKSTNFKPGRKYTLSNSTGSFKLNSFGVEAPVASCGKGFIEAGVIFCDGWALFSFYKKSGRFTILQEGSYHLVSSETFKEDSSNIPTPSVGIGECSTIR